jgi:MFS family permease
MDVGNTERVWNCARCDLHGCREHRTSGTTLGGAIYDHDLASRTRKLSRLCSRALSFSLRPCDMPTDNQPISINAARNAVATVFFINGFGFASWVSRIPAVRASLGLSDGQLGTALFGLAVGALVSFPLAGKGTSLRGARTVTVVSSVLYCLALLAPATVPNLLLLALSLFVFGFASGAMDVAMNALAVEVENLSKKPVMSMLHGMWSLGGLAGALTGSFFAKQNVAAANHLFIAGVLLLVALVLSKRWLPRSTVVQEHSAPHFVRPEAAMIGLGLIVFCSFLIEGAMADWSAVLLRDTFITSEATAALGYAAFSLAMMAMRFAGDRIILHWNATSLLRTSNVVAAAAFAIALWSLNVPLMMLALTLVGIGVATVAPLVFRAAGKRSRRGPGNGIAAMATLGYGGFLVGPPLVGWVAEATTLRIALVVIVVLALMIVALAHHLREDASVSAQRERITDDSLPSARDR